MEMLAPSPGTAGKIARIVCAALIVCKAGPYGRAQQPAPLDDYSQQLLGLWQSEEKVEGQPRVICEIRMDNGKPAGTLMIRESNGGKSGVTIGNVQFEFAALSFKTDMPQQGAKEWVLRLMTSEKALFCEIQNYAEVPKWMLDRVEGH
jgi:hypothetical protein